jgi:hypothetical protein
VEKEVLAAHEARQARFSAATKAGRGKLYARPFAQAAWLLTFARQDVPTLSEDEKYRLSVELLVFAKGTPMPTRREATMIGEPDLPTPDVLHRANLRARHVFGNLAAQGSVDLEASKWSATLRLDTGRLAGTVLFGGLALIDAFTMRLYETLTDLPGKHAWLYPCAICHKLFIAKRRDSRLCSSSCRTLQWRRDHPEEFRAKRAEAYQRMLQRKTGQKRVRVQARRKVAPAF